MLSYWEKDQWTNTHDIVIIGAGIVGLQTAIQLRKSQPDASILILERGRLPSGASTKNAGFACFGSIGEIKADMQAMGEKASMDLLIQRFEGLEALKSTIGEESMDYQACGSYEVFDINEARHFQACMDTIEEMNSKVEKAIGLQKSFSLAQPNFGFLPGINYIKNNFEGAIHPGKMMKALIRKAYELEISILWNTSLDKWTRKDEGWVLETSIGQIPTKNIVLCTNAFAKELIPSLEIQAYRNQVYLTTELPTLSWNTTFHAQGGYIYFRNIGKRILIGGARHKFMKDESTTEFGTTGQVKDYLKRYLEEQILGHPITFDHEWSGILSGGADKKVLIENPEKGLYYGVRLGGMGIAIGSWVGKELAHLVSSQH